MAVTANGPLMARDARISQRARGVGGTIAPLTRAFAVERVTRIELAWPAWKAGALPLSYTRVVEHGVGATGLEPAIFCSQSRRASHYATPRPAGTPCVGGTGRRRPSLRAERSGCPLQTTAGRCSGSTCSDCVSVLRQSEQTNASCAWQAHMSGRS